MQQLILGIWRLQGRGPPLFVLYGCVNLPPMSNCLSTKCIWKVQLVRWLRIWGKGRKSLAFLISFKLVCPSLLPCVSQTSRWVISWGTFSTFPSVSWGLYPAICPLVLYTHPFKITPVTGSLIDSGDFRGFPVRLSFWFKGEEWSWFWALCLSNNMWKDSFSS